MGQVAAKAKQGAEQVTQKTDKDGKVVPKDNEAKALIDFMGKHYESIVQPVKTFDEFYHAIYELIEMFCEERGQLQYKMPSKKKLEEAYQAVHQRGTADLSKDDFFKITSTIITIDSFTFGKAAIDVLMAVHQRGTADLSKDDFFKITSTIITIDSFTFGKAAIDVLMVLFGAPMGALLAKRIVPGLKSFSDDIVIPMATSGAVVYLAKTNKL